MTTHAPKQATLSRPDHIGSTVIVAAVVGAAVGVVTSYLQGVLPGSINFLANSGAVWSLVAFAVTLARRTTPVTGALTGTVVLLSEVLGYYAIASPLRDIATSKVERALWTGAALVLGPAIGFAGHCARDLRAARRSAAFGAVAGLVAGEALHALVRLGHPVQGWSELAVAAIVCGLGAKSPRGAAIAVAAGALVALAGYIAYGLP